MNRKFRFLIVACLTALLATVVLAGSVRVFSATTAAAATGQGAVICEVPAGSGQIRDLTINWGSVATNTTMQIYRFGYDTTSTGAVAGATAVVVFASSSGKVDGYLPTSSDHVLVGASAAAMAVGATNLQYRGIGSVTTNTIGGTNLVYIGLDAKIRCSAGDVVWVGRDTDKQSIPVTTTAKIEGRDLFAGVGRGPVVLVIPIAAGGGTVSGTYVYE